MRLWPGSITITGRPVAWAAVLAAVPAPSGALDRSAEAADRPADGEAAGVELRPVAAAGAGGEVVTARPDGADAVAAVVAAVAADGVSPSLASARGGPDAPLPTAQPPTATVRTSPAAASRSTPFA